MFRRRPRPESPPKAPDRLDRLLQNVGKPPAPPEVAADAGVAAAPACWQDAVNRLLDGGYIKLGCPGTCRRKGDHAHLRHEAAATDLVVSPAVVERGGA